MRSEYGSRVGAPRSSPCGPYTGAQNCQTQDERSAAECWVELMTCSPGFKHRGSQQRRRERGQQIKSWGVAWVSLFHPAVGNIHVFGIFLELIFHLRPATFHSNVHSRCFKHCPSIGSWRKMCRLLVRCTLIKHFVTFHLMWQKAMLMGIGPGSKPKRIKKKNNQKKSKGWGRTASDRQ